MHAPPEPLVDRLVAQLPTITEVRWVDRIPSTNAALLAEGGPAGRVLGADVQTAGRGRRGRSWFAPPGTSLMLSLLLRPALPVAAWGVLPLLAGSAVVQAARAVLPPADAGRLALKWPNDLLVDGVKAAGVLVEVRADAAVVGMGINVDWRRVDRPAEVRATSLAEAAGAAVDRWLLLEHLLTALDRGVRQAEVDPGGVVRRYVVDCGTIGAQVIAHGPSPVTGTAVGLTLDGHLQIRDDDGRISTVTAGDVEHLR